MDMNNPIYIENDYIPTEAIVPDEAIEKVEAQPQPQIPVPEAAPADTAAKISVGISSLIGSRKVQQDCARADDPEKYRENNIFLAVMCDGMGGMTGGEIASNLVVTKLFDAFYSFEVAGKAPAFFRYMVDELDKAVYNLTDENGHPLHSGSTLTAVIIEGRSLYWVSVGDSRIYLKRGGEIVCVTEDHNYSLLLERKVKSGAITREQADNDPEKDALISFMGIGGVRYIDINPNPVELMDGDCVLLCSDGLYRVLSKEDIGSIIDSFYENTSIAAEALTNAAVGMGKRNQDNTTAVLLRFTEGSRPAEAAL